MAANKRPFFSGLSATSRVLGVILIICAFFAIQIHPAESNQQPQEISRQDAIKAEKAHREKYWAFGFSFGKPGGVNLNLSYMWPNVSVQVSGNLENARRWSYGVFGYNLNWDGFFLEIGISLGKGDFTSPQPHWQIGYVHRFNLYT